MSGYAIEARGLAKSFSGTRAVERVDLAVPAGAVYGLLGPNGAGKTTTIRMLATLLLPDAGSATVLGHDLVRNADAVRARISLTGQFASVDEDLTGRENLVFLARLLGYDRAGARRRSAQLLDAFGLAEAAGRSVKSPRASSSRPTCCSSTSQRPASTLAAGIRSGRSFAPSPPGERRCC
jgi:daunorubicin/doxorubicin transport system ATP-binding protein